MVAIPGDKSSRQDSNSLYDGNEPNKVRMGAMITDVQDAPWAALGPEPYAGRVHTARDLAALPESAWQYELVAGRLVYIPPPGANHGYLILEIGAVLREYVKHHSLGRVYAGDVGYNLTLPGEPGETVLGADVSFVSLDRLQTVAGEDPYLQGGPDLAVEIASPSQFRPEMGIKAWLWVTRGTRLAWVIWPNRCEVDVWTPGNDIPVTLGIDGMLDGADVLPGFSYALADLFA
jgi:Uma2 family endonuclease